MSIKFQAGRNSIVVVMVEAETIYLESEIAHFVLDKVLFLFAGKVYGASGKR